MNINFCVYAVNHKYIIEKEIWMNEETTHVSIIIAQHVNTSYSASIAFTMVAGNFGDTVFCEKAFS